MKFLSKKIVEAMIAALDDGTMFSVVFEKADGTMRRMVCRTGVTKHLKGGEATYNKNNPDNIGVFDTEAGEYRCFNGNKVHRIKGGGATITAGELDDEVPVTNARGEAVKI